MEGRPRRTHWSVPGDQRPFADMLVTPDIGNEKDGTSGFDEDVGQAHVMPLRRLPYDDEIGHDSMPDHGLINVHRGGLFQPPFGRHARSGGDSLEFRGYRLRFLPRNLARLLDIFERQLGRGPHEHVRNHVQTDQMGLLLLRNSQCGLQQRPDTVLRFEADRIVLNMEGSSLAMANMAAIPDLGVANRPPPAIDLGQSHWR